MDVLELHVALSRQMFGPDVVASVTTAELTDLVDRHPLHRADAGQPAGQGRVRARNRAAAPPVHAQPGGAAAVAGGHGAASASSWRSRSPARACRPTGSTTWSAGGCCASVDADHVLMPKPTSEGLAVRMSPACERYGRSASSSRRAPATRASARRCRRSARAPTSSCSWSSRRRRCWTATATPSRRSSATASTSPNASTWCSRARTWSPPPSPPASACRSWPRCSTTASRTRW